MDDFTLLPVQGEDDEGRAAGLRPSQGSYPRDRQRRRRQLHHHHRREDIPFPGAERHRTRSVAPLSGGHHTHARRLSPRAPVPAHRRPQEAYASPLAQGLLDINIAYIRTNIYI